MDLAVAYERCTRLGEPSPAPNAKLLEVVAPDVASVVSGERVRLAVELRNRSGQTLPLSFSPDISAIVTFRGVRIDAQCPGSGGAPATDYRPDANAPSVFIELLPDGVLRVPISVTAWGTVTEAEGGECMLGKELARAPLPEGHYDATLHLPWSWSRTVRLEVAERATSLGSDWPRGESAISCDGDSDCILVGGPCRAQPVNRAFASQVLMLHEALTARGACAVDPSGAPRVPRCLDTFCVSGRP